VSRKRTILIAALNWGIGHATRDIPIIDRFLKRGCRVILASDGAALDVWKRTYPNLEHIELPSWKIKYQRRGSFTLNLATRTPYVLKAISEERKLIAKIIKDYNVDGLISDNRFGVHSNDIPTVFITHQVSLRLTKSLRFAEPLINYCNHAYIKKFDKVWVPDFEKSPNLSGELSHKHKLNNNVSFVGPISRFMDVWDGKFPVIDNDVAIVLSGVEPQRTLLEEKLIEQLTDTDYNVILVQGKSKSNRNDEIRPGFKVQSFMDSEELVKTFLRSKYIICRSGYSTILDLAVLKQTALMIPTPGQTEQVYLAEWMNDEGLIVSQDQRTLELKSALLKLENSKGFDFEINDDLLQQAIDDFLERIN